MTSVSISYKTRAAYPSEMLGVLPLSLVRYNRHFGYSHDWLDSLWVLVEVSNGIYTVRSLSTRTTLTSPIKLTESEFLTHFHPR